MLVGGVCNTFEAVSLAANTAPRPNASLESCVRDRRDHRTRPGRLGAGAGELGGRLRRHAWPAVGSPTRMSAGSRCRRYPGLVLMPNPPGQIFMKVPHRGAFVSR